MKKMDVHRDDNNRAASVLIAGDLAETLVVGAAAAGCVIRTNALEAIEEAGSHRFSLIAVTVAGGRARLASILTALRQTAPDAEIVLLARMHEEPIAAALTRTDDRPSPLADDYLICPVSADDLIDRLGPAEPAETAQTPRRVDEETLSRIRQLERLATEDDLTGLKNRRYLWEFARQIIDLAAAENGQVTLLVFDIDDFKHYNDVYGHATGDRILREAAELIKRCCREHDVVARIGGDEFAVIFWDDSAAGADSDSERRSAQADHPDQPLFIARRFRNEIERAELHVLGPEGDGELTISGGLAGFPRDGSTIEELFQKADEALLAAKRSGKNRIHIVGSPRNDIDELEQP